MKSLFFSFILLFFLISICARQKKSCLFEFSLAMLRCVLFDFNLLERFLFRVSKLMYKRQKNQSKHSLDLQRIANKTIEE